MLSLRTGLIAGLAFGLAPVIGCTFLASFNDDTSADAGATHPTDATMGDDASTTASDDAMSTSTDSSTHVVNPDANSPGDDDGDDTTEEDGSASFPYPSSMAPPDASPLAKPSNSACDPCLHYTSYAYTCGFDHESTSCTFDNSAVYLCPGDGGAVVAGYECPNGEDCYPAGQYNSICNPCGDNDGGVSYVLTQYTNSSFRGQACVQCIGATANDIYECDKGSSCPCSASNFDGGD